MRLRSFGVSSFSRFSWRIGISEASSSRVRTFLAVSASSVVSAPSPGPISRTVSDWLMFAAFTIFLIIVFDCRKFCPKFFLALTFKAFVLE